MSEPLARAKAINEKYQAEVAKQIKAINQAILVVWLFTVLGIIALSEADSRFKAENLRNQEVDAYAYRR